MKNYYAEIDKWKHRLDQSILDLRTMHPKCYHLIHVFTDVNKLCYAVESFVIRKDPHASYLQRLRNRLKNVAEKDNFTDNMLIFIVDFNMLEKEIEKAPFCGPTLCESIYCEKIDLNRGYFMPSEFYKKVQKTFRCA